MHQISAEKRRAWPTRLPTRFRQPAPSAGCGQWSFGGRLELFRSDGQHQTVEFLGQFELTAQPRPMFVERG